MQLLFDAFEWITGFIDTLTGLVTDSPLTYLVILAMSAVDVLLPILPAEATVTAAAVLAGQGTLSLAWIMVAAAIGAFLGDNVAYWIGRAAGRPLVERVLRGQTAQLDAVSDQFERRGGMFIIVGRFIPGGRTAVSVGAGVLHFRYVRFVVFDALATVVWALMAALPGFIGGTIIADQPWLAMVIGFGLSALLATIIALIQRRRDKVQARAAPVKPAVVGIGGAVGSIETYATALAEVEAEASGAGTERSAGAGSRRDRGPS